MFLFHRLSHILLGCIVALLLLGALSGCTSPSDRPALAVPQGEWRQLNPGQWAWDGNAISRPMPGSATATGLSLARREAR